MIHCRLCFLLTQAKKHIIYLLLLGILSYFSLFHQLGRLSLRYWDEASYALNAWEMLETGEVINLYQFGEHDFYNTKPPLAIWCMAASMKVFGINEFGVRFPSALFALFSVLWLYYFCSKWLKMPEAGFIAGCILISSAGFVTEHAARTGDTDAILAFFILFYTTVFYGYLTTGKNKYIWLSFLGLTCACLTKGIAGLPGVPVLLVATWYYKKTISFLRNPQVYLAAGLFVFVIVGYYLLREYKAPGFIAYMKKFEIGGRLNRQEFLNPEPRGFMYFFKQFFEKDKWMPWLVLVLTWPVALFYKTEKGEKKAFVFSLIVLFSVYGLLGLSSTKNDWYDVPLYPLLALCSAIALYLIGRKKGVILVLTMMGGFFFYKAYVPIVKRNINQPEDLRYESFLSDLRVKQGIRDTIRIVNADFYFPIHFYAKVDRMNGYPTVVNWPQDSVYQKGKLIVTFKEAREVDMKRMYEITPLYVQEDAKLFRVEGNLK